MTSPTELSRPARASIRFAVALLACVGSGLFSLADVPTAVPALKPVPESIAELKALQEQAKKVVDRVLPCIVCVRLGGGQGSGVIVSADGYVLTAAHVSGAADREVTIIFPDGRKVKGQSRGANRKVDSGLVKITESGPWPHVEMGHSADLQRGQWCLAIGHPGGYRSGRPPVVRFGRILDTTPTTIQTDCTLVGGDSGGPLFDLDGKVIGIHSRIGNSIAANIHVPVDVFQDAWERLVAGDVWGGRFPGQTPSEPYLGVRGDPDADSCKVSEVVPGSPAERAGLQADDVVVRFAGKTINTFEELTLQVQMRSPGDPVDVEVNRDGTILTLRAVLGRRPDPDE
jgi:serine protease Do